jgi:hypothetical protein
MLHQQTHVLLIHRLKATKKAKPSCYMMDEVCHFVWCCSLSCHAVIFELLFRLNLGTVTLFYKNRVLLRLCCNNWISIPQFTFFYFPTRLL